MSGIRSLFLVVLEVVAATWWHPRLVWDRATRRDAEFAGFHEQVPSGPGGWAQPSPPYPRTTQRQPKLYITVLGLFPSTGVYKKKTLENWPLAGVCLYPQETASGLEFDSCTWNHWRKAPRVQAFFNPSCVPESVCLQWNLASFSASGLLM